jgi:hypothetical protein
LAALGVDRLARLVIDEVERNAAFKKVVAGALAGSKGPKAVVAIVDRRLAALKRARGFVDWDKSRAFAADLGATVQIIVEELGTTAPGLAAECLLRFIATHPGVFDRVDDSSGRIQDVYETAIEAIAPIVAGMTEEDRRLLPDLIGAQRADDSQGYWILLAQRVAPLLPADTLVAWDELLAAQHSSLPLHRPDVRDFTHDSRARELIAVRQAIAEAMGDLDGYIALEEAKPATSRDEVDIAERLTTAGRHEEALAWVRRPRKRRIGFMTHADVADGASVQDYGSKPRILLEARILDALGKRDEAQAVRWVGFETMLDTDLLREHVRHLDDFAEFEVLDRAFAHVTASPQQYRALVFFLDWPRLDLAADLVVAHRATWNGRLYDLLVPAAAALEVEHPLAATILYRALLDEILASARSAAYGHGARYLERLDDLAGDLPDDAGTVVDTPATYREQLLKSHGRKSGFWALVR